MAFIIGTSTDYQAFADMLSRAAVGTSLQTITAISAGGTGYTVGDVLTVSGGTSWVAAQIEVLAVSSGVITSARILNAGIYSATPSNNASVTGGTGSGATFTLSWGTNGWTRLRATNVANTAQSATVAAGGSGYVVGDTLTLSGGTAVTQATFRVATVSSGAVTSVTLLTPGNYVTNPGSPVSTTGGTGTGCTLTVTFGGTGERELILQGSGSGSDQIIVGYRTFNDSGSGARNILVSGFTGFNSALTYDNQPGRSPGLNGVTSGADLGGCYLLLSNSTINWWISVTSRRIIAVCRVGSCYSSMYAGFLNPFATAGEWPYPIFIGGTSSNYLAIPSTSNISTSSVLDPIAHASGSIAGPGEVRTPAGNWVSVANGFQSGSARNPVTSGVLVSPGSTPSVSKPTSDDWFSTNTDDSFLRYIPSSGIPGTPTATLLRTTNSGGDLFPLFPGTVVYAIDVNTTGVYGEIDGFFWLSAAGTAVAENRFSVGTTRYRIFQSGVRTDNWALFALRES